VWLSTAARTRQTAALAVADLDPVALEPEPWLYRATPEEVIARLTEIPEDPEGVMVVGHNPTVHALAFLLTGDSRLSVGFPTATLATISFAVDWAQLSEGLGDLEELWTPPGASHTGSSPAFP
jgi:phosphohistidine phosphatase